MKGKLGQVKTITGESLLDVWRPDKSPRVTVSALTPVELPLVQLLATLLAVSTEEELVALVREAAKARA